MEKIKVKTIYVARGGDGPQVLSFSVDGLTQKAYQIESGYFCGDYIVPFGDGLVLCDDVEGQKFKGYSAIELSGIEELSDVDGLAQKRFDTQAATSVVMNFIDAYVAVKGNDMKTLQDIDMVTFAKYYQVLSPRIFAVSDTITGVKSEAFKFLEHVVDQKTKGFSAEQKDEFKKKARHNLQALIDVNLSKDEGDPSRE